MPANKEQWDDQFRSFCLSTAELQAVDLTLLSRYLHCLLVQSTFSYSYSRDNQRLAFWLNIFHTMLLHAHLEKGFHSSNRAHRRGFFKNYCYIIGDLLFSIDEVEHGILRGNRASIFSSRPFEVGNPRVKHMVDELDPRLHFAVSYGMKNDPPVSSQGRRIHDANNAVDTSILCRNNRRPVKYCRCCILQSICRSPHA